MTKFKKVAFIFPGQGAQYAGMGKDFYEQFALVKETFQEADDILGRNLSTIILQGPDALLTETKNSQTGIYVLSIALVRLLRSLFPALNASVCAGLSLGEYTALTASERVEFKDCLPLVQLRGQYMNDACEAVEGTMAVVLGLDAEAVEALVKEANMPNDLWAANFNCPGQVVISGTKKGIEVGAEIAKSKGAKRVLPLTVHGAFHSGLMRQAEERLASHIHDLQLKSSPISFVMNVPGDFVTDTAAIKENLIRQVTSPVRWEQGIRKMNESGVDLFVEIGCGKALTGFNKRIGTQGVTISLEKVEELESLNQIL